MELPRFLLDNKILITSHINALVLETIDIKLPSKPAELLNLNDDCYPIEPSFKKDIESYINKDKQKIFQAVKDAFFEEINKFSWFDDKFIEDNIEQFTDKLDSSFDYWRHEYSLLLEESNDIHIKTSLQGTDRNLQRRKEIVDLKLENMREGKLNYYIYRYLGSQGFLA